MNIKSHDCKEELREHALKATPNRLAVLNLLERIDKPIDVATIIDYLKQHDIDMDPVTAFRIMNLFTDKGLTKKVEFQEGKSRYELLNNSDHHHLVCENCGDVEDISDCRIGELEQDIEQKKKFLVKRHSLEFFGICKNCQV